MICRLSGQSGLKHVVRPSEFMSSRPNTVDGKREMKGPGSLIYEPFGLVHQWGNPGDMPFTFLAFNINPQGVAAVLPGAPAEGQ
jgi:oxalate decarboxylase/phosphoglucose isomerase-like protein (cupin superfamily)